MAEQTYPTPKPVTPVTQTPVKDTKDTKDSKAIAPKELEPNKIPDGAMDPQNVRPGYGPLEGSPNPSDPTKLFNPFNPNSPVTRPTNPSNPANMPQTQSEKPASERAVYEAEMKLKNPPPVNDAYAKEQETLTKEKADLAKKISEALNKYDGRESAIPASNEYWVSIARLRVLSNP